MKLVLVLLCSLTLSTAALAQTVKKMSPPPVYRTTTPTTLPVYTAPSAYQSEVTGLFGMVAGAINFGVTYIRPSNDFGFGGYLFYQTAKEKNKTPVVSQMTAFGALIKVNVYENRSLRAYLAPGFGMAMIKEGSVSATGSKSDENVISPTFKMGIQYKTAGNFIIGLERMQFSNWLNDSLNNYAGPAEYYTVAASFEF